MGIDSPGKPTRLARATSVVMVASVASMALGIFRESLTAAHFGATAATDAYFFAFSLIVRLPEFLQAAIASSLIPVYLRSKKEGHSTTFINTVINSYALFLLAVTGLGLVGLPLIVSILGSGFDAESRSLLTHMILILSPVIVLAGVWGVFRSLLNAEGEFFRSNISTAFLSVGIISAILLLSPQVGIYSLPIGVLVAATLQVLWTGYWSRSRGFRYRISFDWKEPGFRRFIALSRFGILGSIFSFLIPVIDRAIATHFPKGTIAALSYAGRPMYILSSLAIYSFVTAILPSFSQKALDQDRRHFRENVTKVLGLLVFITIPLSFLMVTLRMPVIQLLFERGRFDSTATIITADFFAAIAIGLAPMAVAITVSAFFNAMEDTRTPALFGAGGNLVAKILLNILLVVALGAIGLPLASAAMYTVSAIVLLLLLRRRLHGIGGRYLLRTLSSVLSATLVAVAPVYLLTLRLDAPPLFVLIAGTLLGSIVFLLAAAALRIPELQMAHEHIVKVVGRKFASVLFNKAA